MQALQIREFLASVTPALSLHFIRISLQIANLQGEFEFDRGTCKNPSSLGFVLRHSEIGKDRAGVLKNLLDV
jgi:hypothetical protein